MRPNLLKDDEFSVWVPNVVEFDFEKAEEDQQGNLGFKLAGYCSTETRDRQEEIVVQKGLDFSEFVAHGYFNDNHKQGTVDIVGYPTLAEMHEDRGWYTEGFLFKGYPPAEKIVMLAKAMAQTPRRLGFSIEGKVIERGHDNRIVRAKVRNVAVTNCPVNTECTWSLMSKAFATSKEIEASYEKALAAGGSNPGGAGGAALRAQSLEGGKTKKKMKKFAGEVAMSHTRKGLSLRDAVGFLQRIRPDLSEQTCRRIVQWADNAAE